MINSILTIMKVETSIFINGFLYFLKKIFFLKNVLKSTSYSFLKIKNVLGYVALIYQVIWSSIKAIMIPLIFIILPGLVGPVGRQMNPYILIFVFYFILRLMSSALLELNNQKFIMVKELRMNPRVYSHAFLLKKEGFKFIGRTAAFLLLGAFLSMSFERILLTSVMATLVSCISEAAHLYLFKKKGFILEEHNILLIIIYLTLMFTSYGAFYLLPGLTPEKFMYHPVFIAALAAAAVLSAGYIMKYDRYSEALRRATSLEKMSKLQNAVAEARFADVKMKDKDFVLEETDKVRYESKEGFAYLSAIFFDRHKKFFRKPILVKTAIVAALFSILIGAGLIFNQTILLEAAVELPGEYHVFIFAMYMLCNSNRETKAMFYNCDLFMLNYGFYRQPKALLEMFTLRLKRIVIGNMIPTIAVIVGLLLLSTVSGARNYMEILPVIFMLIALSLFFSIHYIFMYYIFQPYTSSMEVKNPFFSIINGLVYFLSYMALQIRTPAENFLPFIIIFSILYALVAVTLVYKKAPQTFRVK